MASSKCFYHGSGRIFDRFDPDKSGSGQGVEKFGRGIYLAENPALADFYRRDITHAYLLCDHTLLKAGDVVADNAPERVEFEAVMRDREAYREFVREWKAEGGVIETGALYEVSESRDLVLLNEEEPELQVDEYELICALYGEALYEQIEEQIEEAAAEHSMMTNSEQIERLMHDLFLKEWDVAQYDMMRDIAPDLDWQSVYAEVLAHPLDLDPDSPNAYLYDSLTHHFADELKAQSFLYETFGIGGRDLPANAVSHYQPEPGERMHLIFPCALDQLNIREVCTHDFEAFVDARRPVIEASARYEEDGYGF